MAMAFPPWSCISIVDVGGVLKQAPSVRQTIGLAMLIVASAAAPALAHPGAGIVMLLVDVIAR